MNGSVDVDEQKDPVEFDLCVVGGCGRVGLPLALSFAHHAKRVLILDIDQDALAKLANGEMPHQEEDASRYLTEAMQADRLAFSSDFNLLKKTNVVIVAVGTPEEGFEHRSMRLFDQLLSSIEQHLGDGSLLILRSTLFPGVTSWIESFFTIRNRDIAVAYCPERILEGNALTEITLLPQIVGANHEASSARAKQLFSVFGTTLITTTANEAEFAKLLTNSWRYLKFAIANEFFSIVERAGISYENVFRAITTGYPRAEDLPLPGFAAGPCLTKDVQQLVAFDDGFLIGQAAVTVNQGFPQQLIELIETKASLVNRSVAILGMAFKGDSDDERNSLSPKLAQLLAERGAKVLCTDPYVDDPSFVSLDKALSEADIVIIGAPHSCYRGLSIDSSRLIDVWGLVSGVITA